MLIDGALHLGRCGREDIANLAAHRRRGAPRLRQALALADGRSESPWESLLRLFHLAVEAPVTPQADIVDDVGAFIARADLLIVGTQHLQEYDGAGHRDAAQHASDLRRDRRLAAAGYRRNGYMAPDLTRRDLDLLRDIDEALGRQHDRRRVLGWRELLAASMFTAEGTGKLMARWTNVTGSEGSGPGFPS